MQLRSKVARHLPLPRIAVLGALVALGMIAMLVRLGSTPATAGEDGHVFLWTDPGSGGQVQIIEDVLKGCSDGHVDELTFQYTVNNLSYDPVTPDGQLGNGFSGFQIIFKNAVPELHNQLSPALGGPWEQNAFSGAWPPFGIEWDAPPPGVGIMPGEIGVFSFCTYSRQDLVVNDPPADPLGQGPNGWAHSWHPAFIQSNIFNGGISIPGELLPIAKSPRLANLWLCDASAPTCDNRESGVEEVSLDLTLDGQILTRDPKCTGFPNFLPPEECPVQQIGSLEFEVRYDDKFIELSVDPAPGMDGMECLETHLEGIFRAACVTKGKPETAPTGNVTIATLRARPTADVYKLLTPNQENGIVTELINQDCQLSDLQGHPIDTGPCENAAITIRYLEGDVHSDCVIDVLDQQQVAFRWGAELGSLLYAAQYDLEPSFPGPDGDIDAKDLQFVYGRHLDPTSTCKTPHPPQEPIDPQAKLPPVG